MEDAEIEQVVRRLVEEHCDERTRKPVLQWLEERATAYQAMVELGFLGSPH
jgi:uncharacterized protein YggL (DUF469 family)